jgi:hypothetical protein
MSLALYSDRWSELFSACCTYIHSHGSCMAHSNIDIYIYIYIILIYVFVLKCNCHTVGFEPVKNKMLQVVIMRVHSNLF